VCNCRIRQEALCSNGSVCGEGNLELCSHLFWLLRVAGAELRWLMGRLGAVTQLPKQTAGTETATVHRPLRIIARSFGNTTRTRQPRHDRLELALHQLEPGCSSPISSTVSEHGHKSTSTTPWRIAAPDGVRPQRQALTSVVVHNIPRQQGPISDEHTDRTTLAFMISSQASKTPTCSTLSSSDQISNVIDRTDVGCVS
jgi:hypothetical protein